MSVIVKGKKIDPTQTLMEMTYAHTDETGTTWPKLTQYQPSSAGIAGGVEYQDVVIKGEHVRFVKK